MKRTLLSLITGAGLLLTTGCSCQKEQPAQVVSEPNQTLDLKQVQEKQAITTEQPKETKTMSKITRTSSGLGYEVLTPGTGPKPTVGQTVTVHYSGYLDKDGELGKKFDSSVDRGQPFSTQIGVGRVIAGWDQGLLDMQVGETRRLYIPSNLGYGARGAGAAIPPNANLIFDVELIAVR